MSKCFVLLLLCVSVVSGHDTYSGRCPKFQAMSGFDWNKVIYSQLSINFVRHIALSIIVVLF